MLLLCIDSLPQKIYFHEIEVSSLCFTDPDRWFNYLRPAEKKAKVIRTLIVDGQNNHDQWPKLTYMMKQYLEETGKFSVDVQRTHYTWKGDEFLADYRYRVPNNTVALAKARHGFQLPSRLYPSTIWWCVILAGTPLPGPRPPRRLLSNL